jgi:hypothetical protein
MKRTNTALKVIAMAGTALAISAGPATASTGYPSITSITGSGVPAVAPPHQADHTSINATLGAAPSQADSKAAVNSSLNSIVGAQQPVPEQAVTVVREDSGFSWSDAVVGGAGALVLALLSLATLHTLRRREGVTIA